MIGSLFALALSALAGTCDIERPDGFGGCTRAAADRLTINQVQMIGTHNSYKQAIDPAEFALIMGAAPDMARTLDYGHLPLPQELDLGARQLEIDLINDPGEGGRYANPLAHRMAAAAAAPYDFSGLQGPGLKVLHVQDIDYRASCNRFTDCLTQIRAWSRAHPDHLPILILINLKEDKLPVPGSTDAAPFDAAAMNQIDREIRSVFAAGDLITPDQVQGRYPTLRDAVRAGAWPKVGQARGRVFFALDAPTDQVARYRENRRSLEGRVMFVNIDEASPASAYITLNDPIRQQDRIRADVAAGLIVRTRADADTVQARTNDISGRQAAFASGAQYISTDYLRADPRFTSYFVAMPGGLRGRISPALLPR